MPKPRKATESAATTATTTPRKATKAPKAVKKAPKADTNGKSLRTRVFEVLAKAPNGLTAKEIADKLGLSRPTHLIKDESMAGKRMKREHVEGSRAVVYSLTAAGQKALKAGKVDENLPPSTKGTSDIREM